VADSVSDRRCTTVTQIGGLGNYHARHINGPALGMVLPMDSQGAHARVHQTVRDWRPCCNHHSVLGMHLHIHSKLHNVGILIIIRQLNSLLGMHTAHPLQVTQCWSNYKSLEPPPPLQPSRFSSMFRAVFIFGYHAETQIRTCRYPCLHLFAPLCTCV
jgi:hypothetical protein